MRLTYLNSNYVKNCNLQSISLTKNRLFVYHQKAYYRLKSAVLYEGWNFNFGNAAVTFDTAHLQSSYFHRLSMYSLKVCRTRSQR